ncbi:MAG: ABC transporter substrate-binding protein [Sulfuricurvum sp.]|nr:ABC transporter substrate-binding protein [Sulfuricurvum sp.]
MKLGLMILMGVLLFTGCSAFKKPEELRVGILSWPGYEPLALADSLNYYDEKIKIIRFPSVIDVLGAMRNGTIDVAALTIDESMVYAQENPEIRAFLICDISNGGDGVVAKEGITIPAQLKGKRIAAEESALSSYVLNRFLKASGLGLSDITVVPVNYDIQLQTFSSDQADAVITYNPVKDQLIAQGGKLLFDSSKMPGEIVDVLIARDSVLKDKKASVISLVNGWFKSLKYMSKNAKDANKRMASFEGVSEELFARSLEGIKIPTREESVQMLTKGKGSIHETSVPLIQNMRTQGLLREDSSFENLFTSEYIGMK